MNGKVWKRTNVCVIIAVLTIGSWTAGTGIDRASAAAGSETQTSGAGHPQVLSESGAVHPAAENGENPKSELPENESPPTDGSGSLPAESDPSAGEVGEEPAAPSGEPDSEPEASRTDLTSSVPVVDNDFESGTVGSAPAGWTIGTPPAGVSAKIAQSAERGGKVLRIQQAAPVASGHNFRRAAAVSTDRASLSYSFSVDQTNAVVYLPTPSAAGQASMVQFAVYGGEISYQKQGVNGWIKLMPVEAGTWYDVRVAMNSAANTFDLDVDGRRLLTKEPMKNAGPMASFYVSVYRENPGSASFDDFVVENYVPAVSASFAETQYEVATGRAINLKPAFSPENATDRNATFSSSDETVATVDANGRVTGVAPGTATISAQPDENIPAAQTTVSVVDIPATGVQIVPLDGPVPVGSRVLLDATIQPEDTTEAELLWLSSDESVATVDGYGEVTGVSPGQATITARSANGTAEGQASVAVTARTVMTELFVSPQGSDTGDGSQGAPFATIGRAQQEVRALNDNMTGDIVVNLDAGTYELAQTLAFTPEDSGSDGHFVIYRGAGGEQTVVSGGRSIAGWTETQPGSGIYRANVDPGLETRQLFVDGVRAVRARSEGGLERPNKTATGYTSRDTDIASWSDADELELVFEDAWTNSRVRVQSVTAANGLAQFTLRDPGWANVKDRTQTSATLPVYYENARELLDQPGEWYLDGDANVLYYMPREGEDLDDAEVIAPELEQLVTVKGQSADNPVRNLNFENMAFMYSTWMHPSTDAGHSDAQNNYLRYKGSPDELAPGAVQVELANTVNFEGATFAKLGITGLMMQNGVQNSLVQGNRFYDISGGAVNVGQPNSSDRNVFNPADPRLIMKNDDVRNNVIHDIGVDYKSAAAVSAGYPLDMDISHNEMYNLPYSGVHIGYGWAKDFDPVTRNVKVENNLIYDLMGMGLRDGGAIYTLGTTGATAADKNLVRGNYVRNQLEANAALYTDEASAYWKFEGNVIDLKDSPPWSSPMRWAMAYVKTIHDVDYVNNYTTTSTYTNNGTGVVFQNNTVVPDANWPQAAQAIIANAGLEPAYASLNDAEIGRWSTENLKLEPAQSASVVPAERGGKDEALGGTGAEIRYRSLNPAVATVDAQGVVTGAAQGKTSIEIEIVKGSVKRALLAQVRVGDVLTGIALENQPGGVAHVREGRTLELEPYGATLLGDRAALGPVTYASSDDAIFAVNASGELTAQAVGTATLTMTAAASGGGTISSDYEVRVWNEQSADTVSLQPMVEDPDGWYVNTQSNGLSELENGVLALRAPSGYMVYAERKFQNEKLEFGYKIDDAADSANWYAMMLGSQDIDENYNTGTMYLAILNHDKIELHRFNNGKRTILIGKVSSNPDVPGPGGFGVPNTMLTFGQQHDVETGLFQEAGGVRIVLKSDGQVVFDYLDTSPEAIGEAGHLGFISRQRITELSQ